MAAAMITAALAGLAVWVERGRYDATPGPVPSLAGEVDAVTTALWRRADGTHRAGTGLGRGLRRAFPRSLVPGMAAAAARTRALKRFIGV